jgi:geranylgeranyl diphosphate synthase type I
MESLNPATNPVTFRAALDRTLSKFLKEKAAEFVGIDLALEAVLKVAVGYLSAGKRLRPSFAWAGFLAASPVIRHRESLLKAIASLELLHAGLLIHDDLIDDADTRRSQPSAHLSLAKIGGESFGDEAAILLGTLLISWSSELLNSSGFGPDELNSACQIADLTRTEVLGGQFLDVMQAAGIDLLGSRKKPNSGAPIPTVESALEIIRYKTARYTIARPVQLGAALGGASSSLKEALFSFGEPLGIAFQLRDDLLDLFGDESLTGKPIGGDIKEGKQTLLITTALALATPTSAEQLREQLGSPTPNLNVVRGIIAATGAKGEIETRISSYREQALKVLADAQISEEGRATLSSLAWRSVQRVG